MERRDILRSIAATSAGLVFDGVPPLAEEALTDADVDRMIRTMAGAAPPPGQLAAVRELLVSMRFKGTAAPPVQPSLVFDPEVDRE